MSTFSKFRAPLIGFFAVAMGGICFAPSAAQADIFEDAGMTGGDSSVMIKRLSGNGKLTFHLNDYQGGKPSITEFTGPNASAQLTCRRSGYRAKRIEDVNFSRKNAVEEGDTTASLTDEKATIAAIKAACQAKKTKVQLPVTVRGVCVKVKMALGPKHIGVGAPKQMATFDIKCDMDDVDGE
jgi:hypothetical protein